MVSLESEAFLIELRLVGHGHVAIDGHWIDDAVGEKTRADVGEILSRQWEGLRGEKRIEYWPRGARPVEAARAGCAKILHAEPVRVGFIKGGESSCLDEVDKLLRSCSCGHRRPLAQAMKLDCAKEKGLVLFNRTAD